MLSLVVAINARNHGANRPLKTRGAMTLISTVDYNFDGNSVAEPGTAAN